MIDALLGGEAVTFSRYELPSDHPQAPPHGGHPSDLLTSWAPTTCCGSPAIRSPGG